MNFQLIPTVTQTAAIQNLSLNFQKILLKNQYIFGQNIFKNLRTDIEMVQLQIRLKHEKAEAKIPLSATVSLKAYSVTRLSIPVLAWKRWWSTVELSARAGVITGGLRGAVAGAGVSAPYSCV